MLDGRTDADVKDTLSRTEGFARFANRMENDVKTILQLLGNKPAKQPCAPNLDWAQIAPAIPASLLKAEVEALPAAQVLLSSGQFRVQFARAAQIPWCLQEIGRLRETSFRAVGEGTGNSTDIDRFDNYYLHLFLWDAKAEAIVGAYRMGLADEILSRFGKKGLYTQSLFRYGTRLLQALNPAIELGRSFVRLEYQRSYAPLMLLWRGIGSFVERNPRYAVLLGAVSISTRYDPASRQLIVEYLETNTLQADLARHVKAKKRFPRKNKLYDARELSSLKNVEELSRVIARIEPDAKGVPVLLRQYLKLGGRLLGFASDALFNDTLDGLIKVDLRESEPHMLARYMSAEGAARFIEYHEASALAWRRAS